MLVMCRLLSYFLKGMQGSKEYKKIDEEIGIYVKGKVFKFRW